MIVNMRIDLIYIGFDPLFTKAVENNESDQ